MKRKQAEKGITLVILVITVVVMLILAAVAINIAIGDDGLINKAEGTADKYQETQENELAILNGVNSKYQQTLNRIGGGNIEEIPLPKPGEPDKNGIYTENSTINGGDGNAFNPEIPKGFKPVDEGNAVWGNGNNPPAEEAVKAGLIIEDEEGNQFVWVAVDGTDLALKRYVFTETGEIDTTLSKTEPTDQLKITTSATSYTEGLKDDTTLNTHAKDIEGFRTSVAEHGGYYIARYEASRGEDGKPNSKIASTWANVTQPEAAEACRNMYDSNYGITSDLINSYAWDTTLVFIQKYSGDSDYSKQGALNANDSNTGENGDERCHIHDMAGNRSEWTTETAKAGNNSCVLRGSSYSRYNSTWDFADGRLDARNDSGAGNYSFRPILYL